MIIVKIAALLLYAAITDHGDAIASRYPFLKNGQMIEEMV